MERPKPTIEINERVPPMFDRLIMESVQIDPASRPASMDDVADRLNFIRAKLLAEAELRKSGMLPRISEAPGSTTIIESGGASNNGAKPSAPGSAEGSLNPCRHCGHDRGRLPADAACPECGEAGEPRRVDKAS